MKAEVTVESGRIDRCQRGASQEYHLRGKFRSPGQHNPTRLSSQLAREIRFDCPFAFDIFSFFLLHTGVGGSEGFPGGGRCADYASLC